MTDLNFSLTDLKPASAPGAGPLWHLSSTTANSIISVIEEARFLGLNVRFCRDDVSLQIMMAVSTNTDGSRPMDLSDQSARMLLDALGKGSSTSVELSTNELSAILNDQPTRRHLQRSGMQTYLDHLDSMAKKQSVS